MSCATAWVVPDISKALAILSGTIARRFAVDREDLKQYWKSQKGQIFQGDQEAYYLQVSQRLLIKESRQPELQFLTVDFSLTFLITEITDEIFQKSRNQAFFRHIFKSWAMYESLDSQFFRNITGI